MDFQTIITLVGTLEIFWAGLVGVASVIVHLRVIDWKSTMSVHLLFSWGFLGAILALSCIRIITGDSWWFQLLRLLTFTGLVIFMSQRLYLQIKAQCPARDEPDEPPTTPIGHEREGDTT